MQIQHVITDSKLSLDKIGEMREISHALQKTSERFNIKDIESKTNTLLKKTDVLHKSVTAQQQSIHGLFGDMFGEIKAQNASLVGAMAAHNEDLTNIIRNEKERDSILKNSFEALYLNQTNIASMVNTKSTETQGKVKEILTVLSGLQTAADKRRDKEQSLLKNLDVSLIDKIENTLDEHEERLRRTTIVNGLFVIVLTPIVVYAFGKLCQ